jgi:hypothetical protein
MQANKRLRLMNPLRREVPGPINLRGTVSIGERHSISAGILLFGAATMAATIVGLPLYGDGAFYFVEVLLNREPLVPNLRYSAVLPQLPVVAAMGVTDEVVALRHAFSLGYALLPFLSLLFCWLVVRRKAPELILYPALFLVANQINFSAVSELLVGLHLTWPFVLLAAVLPNARTTWAFGLVLAPLLLFLHPIAFALLLLLAAAGFLVSRRSGVDAVRWNRLAAVFLGFGVIRLFWALLSMNAYERSHLGTGPALGYLLPDRMSQTLLLVFVLVLGLLIAAGAGRSAGIGADRAGGSRRRLSRVLDYAIWSVTGLVAVTGLVVAAEISGGEGIRLKSAVVFPLALILMAIALLDAARRMDRVAAGPPVRLFMLLVLTMTAMSLAKSAVWARATDDLVAAMPESAESCLPFGPEEPPALQYPHMTAVDSWTAPMTAMIFQSGHPLVLLLPGDACRRMAETGMAGLTSWYEKPVGLLEQRFGPAPPAKPEP